ncbi:MAG: NAD(P)/FAD-dependent oxidoreductase [Acidobacteriota bacterium]
MARDRETEVLVVGAGPVGLFTGLVLAGKGIQVEIVEEEWRSTARSYALALHPYSLKLLDDLGLARELIEKGHQLHALAFYQKGERQVQLSYTKLPSPFPFILVLPQQALEEALVKRLKKKKVKVEWNHRVDAIESDSHGVRVHIQRLRKEVTGYAVAGTEWVVDKAFTSKARFVVGADGHRSVVRRRLGIGFPEVAQPLLFAVFEFGAERLPEHEVRVVMDNGQTNVLWPMRGGRFRWSFQLESAAKFADPRIKSRLAVQVGGRSYPHLGKDELQQLIAERAPWFDSPIRDVAWSIAVQFESRLADSFGKDRVWMVGDSAHLANPVGVQSMNVGLREAHDLASLLADLLRSKDPFANLVPGEDARAGHDPLQEFNLKRLAEWSQLLGLEGAPRPGDSANDWTSQHAPRILPCIPASGEDLSLLLKQAGLELTER